MANNTYLNPKIIKAKTIVETSDSSSFLLNQWTSDASPSVALPLPGAPVIWVDSQDINLVQNDGISNGDPISLWKNKGSSGVGNDLGQSNALLRPTLVAIDPVLEIPVVAFATQHIGTNVQSGIPTGQPFKVVVVFKYNSTGLQALFDSNNGNEVTVYIQGADMYVWAGSGVIFGGSVTTWSYVIVNFNGASTTVQYNGVDVGPLSPGTNSFTDGLRLGLFSSNNWPLDGSIAEAIVYGNLVAIPSDADIKAYLDSRYGSDWPKT